MKDRSVFWGVLSRDIHPSQIRWFEKSTSKTEKTWTTTMTAEKKETRMKDENTMRIKDSRGGREKQRSIITE